MPGNLPKRLSILLQFLNHYITFVSYNLDLVPSTVNYRIVVQVSGNGFKPFDIPSTLAHSSFFFIVQPEFTLACTAQTRLTPLTSET